MLPPGLAMVLANPLPTGSSTMAQIGIVRVAFCIARVHGTPDARRTSTRAATSSRASGSNRDASPSA
jgi:hypothetical protein